MVIVSQKQNITNPPILTEYKDLLTVEDLSSIFEVSKQTIYKEIKEGKFGNPIKIGRAFKVPKVYILQRYFLGIFK